MATQINQTAQKSTFLESEKSLKTKLAKKKFTLGSWVGLPYPDVVEIMAKSGAFEWLVIDAEHSTVDFEMMKQLIRTIEAHSVSPLVRVGKLDELIIKRALDAGAHGIIVPMIKTAEDAKLIKDYAFYPPMGKRGVGLSRAQGYGHRFVEYRDWHWKELVIIAQIEHIQAVENIEAILSVECLDGIIVGPYDLSASMGYPGEFERDDVKAAIKKVELACKKSNKALGFHVISSEATSIREKKNDGYDFLAFSMDFLFLGDRIKEQFAKLKSDV